LLNIAASVQQLYQEATNSQNQLLPLDEIGKIVGYIQDIITAIQTNGESLLTTRSGLVQGLVGEIDTFFNQTYQVNLNIFRTVQSQLAEGRTNGSALLTALVADGKLVALPYLLNLTKLNTDQLQQLYKRQLAKLLPLINAYRYVETNIEELTVNITQFSTALRDNFDLTLT
jgi:hypothetical protein